MGTLLPIIIWLFDGDTILSIGNLGMDSGSGSGSGIFIILLNFCIIALFCAIDICNSLTFSVKLSKLNKGRSVYSSLFNNIVINSLETVHNKIFI